MASFKFWQWMFGPSKRTVPKAFNPYQLRNFARVRPIVFNWGTNVPANGTKIQLPTDDDLSEHYIVYVETSFNLIITPQGTRANYPNEFYLTLTYDNTELQVNLPGWLLGGTQSVYDRYTQFYPFRMDLDKSYLTVTDNSGLLAGDSGILWFWYLPYDILPCENQ